MKKIKYLVREILRVLNQYTSAIRFEARGQAIGLFSSSFKIMAARILYGIGPIYYSLYRLSGVPRSEWGNYITNGPEFKQFLKSLSPAEQRETGQDKLKFYLHCVQSGLPTIPVICVVSKEPAPHNSGVAWVNTREHWQAAMLGAPDEMFIKPIDGTYGEGAFVVVRNGNMLDFNGRSGSMNELYSFLEERLKHERGWLVQPRMRSHSSLDGIVSAQGLATVRAITHMRQGRSELLIADIKITVGGNVIDNFAKGTTGNLVAGIDRDSGRLGAAWGSVRRDWPVMAQFSHHPDSGKPIEGFQLPFWDDLTQLVLKAQESLPLLRTLGWDVAATQAGVLLVETNTAYDVSILQIAHERGLKREFYSALAPVEQVG